MYLLVEVGAPKASCYESCYVEPNGHMFGASALEVRRAYRRHGLQIERVRAEPDDHLGLMLGFVSRLIEEELIALEAADEERAQELMDEQKRFSAEHILPWLAVWRYNLATYAKSDYFRGVGEFVFGVCASYASRFGIAYNEEGGLFQAPIRNHSAGSEPICLPEGVFCSSDALRCRWKAVLLEKAAEGGKRRPLLALLSAIWPETPFALRRGPGCGRKPRSCYGNMAILRNTSEVSGQKP